MKLVKLLWVDDAQSWASSVQRNLKLVAQVHGIDLKIFPVTNGEGIVQQCMAFDFDGVVMDYHMEPYFGDKYIQDIRAEEHLDGVPIIFYSQDNSTDLEKLVKSFKNISTVYRPNLEDLIKEMFF